MMFGHKSAGQFQAESQAIMDSMGNLYPIAFMEIPAFLKTLTDEWKPRNRKNSEEWMKMLKILLSAWSGKLKLKDCVKAQSDLG